jgi:hypothetical protein
MAKEVESWNPSSNRFSPSYGDRQRTLSRFYPIERIPSWSIHLNRSVAANHRDRLGTAQKFACGLLTQKPPLRALKVNFSSRDVP